MDGLAFLLCEVSPCPIAWPRRRTHSFVIASPDGAPARPLAVLCPSIGSALSALFSSAVRSLEVAAPQRPSWPPTAKDANGNALSSTAGFRIFPLPMDWRMVKVLLGPRSRARAHPVGHLVVGLFRCMALRTVGGLWRTPRPFVQLLDSCLVCSGRFWQPKLIAALATMVAT